MRLKTKKNFTLLDTNIIIALLDEKDSLHKEAKKLIKESISDTYAVLDVILAETYSVLTRRCRERKYDCGYAVEKLKELENALYVVPICIKRYHNEIVEKLKNEPELNYNDWLIVIYAKEKGIKVLTLDKTLDKKLNELLK